MCFTPSKFTGRAECWQVAPSTGLVESALVAGRDARIVRAAAARKRGSALLQRSPAMSPLCLVQRSGDMRAVRFVEVAGGRISLAAHQSIALNTVQRAHHTWNTLIAYRMRTVRIVWNVLVERLSCCLTIRQLGAQQLQDGVAPCSDICWLICPGSLLARNYRSSFLTLS